MRDCRWSHNPTPIEGLLSPTGIELTQFRNFVSKVAGLQVHPTATYGSLMISGKIEVNSLKFATIPSS